MLSIPRQTIPLLPVGSLIVDITTTNGHVYVGHLSSNNRYTIAEDTYHPVLVEHIEEVEEGDLAPGSIYLVTCREKNMSGDRGYKGREHKLIVDGLDFHTYEFDLTDVVRIERLT